MVFDAAERIGDSWRHRYDGLTLFTPRAYSGLADLPMNGDPQGYPDKTEFAAYLETYADNFGLPVYRNARVTSVHREANGTFLLSGTGFDAITAKAVVMATGAFRDPVVPPWADRLPSDVPHLPAEKFGNGRALPDGPLLVVGDGASGRDIALLAARTRPVTLATGRPRRLLPERILGRSVWWWLDRTGLLRAPSASLPGKIMRKADPFPNRQRSLADLKAAGIAIKPRATGIDNETVRFSDGTGLRPAAVVWALGYRADWSILELDGALDEHGQPRHVQGISPVNGLYFVGLPWQRNRASGLVLGVSEDADLIAADLTRKLDRNDIPPLGASAPLSRRLGSNGI